MKPLSTPLITPKRFTTDFAHGDKSDEAFHHDLSCFFLLIALLQLLRFILGWEVMVNGVSVPVWVSGIASVIAAGLAVMVWREMRK